MLATTVLLVTAVALAGCGGPPAPDGTSSAGTAEATGPVGDGATPAAPSSGPSSARPSSAPPPEPATSSVAAPVTTPEEPTPDELAGLLSHEVPESGDGELVVVPGGEPAPGPGTDQVDVALAVEGGVPADGTAFAAFVMSTLNDPRSWPHEGYTFARTDDSEAADVTVVLASPATTDRLCKPLVTYGKLSCRNGNKAVLTFFRWEGGIPEYSDDLTAYRRYLVNHEVGHFLGNGHVSCPAAGALAPVMMQQTKGLAGCGRNSWPYP